MAFIKLKDGRGKFVSPQQGATIWRVLNNEIKGNKQQRMFCKLVDKVYLNKDNAPESWLQAYPPRESRFRQRALATAQNIRLPYKD